MASAQPPGCALSVGSGAGYLGAVPQRPSPRKEVPTRPSPSRREGASRPSSARATLVVMFGIGVSRVFGLVRELVVAFYFGRAAAYSAFVAAYKVPNLVRVLLGEGNLSASFIPVLAEKMRTDPAEAERLARGVLGLLLATVAVLTLAGMAAAPVLAWVVAPGFDPDLRALVERLIVILFPTMALLVLGAWCMGVLHAHGRFFWPNFAPLFWSVVSAGALIAFVGRVDLDPVYVLAWGVVAGSALQLLVQLPATRAALGTLRPAGGWRDPAVRKVVALFTPMLVGTGVAQLSTLVDVQIASFLGGGAVASLAYAQRLYLLPLSLFGVAIAQVALPTLAHDAARTGERVRDELAASWRRMAFLILPSALALVAFGRPAVSLLFERGRFEPADTAAVTWVLAGYAAGLLAYASVRLFATAFYAFHDTRTPVRVAVVALGVNVALGITLAWLLGTPGIALATATAAVANALALGALLRRRLGPLLGPDGRRAAARMAAAAAVAGALALAPYLWLLGRWPAWGLGGRLVGALALYGGIGLVYLGATVALGVEEPRRIRERLARRRRDG
ncbi:MAG TPA: murein biosynthesis integral membrane protein MurJ [Gemmatimonadota bacterium]|nr:murein biosynthesis integral membrane protein MurJ [Gemmatimonadota bacterium]